MVLSAGAAIPDSGDLASALMDIEGGVRVSRALLELVVFFSLGEDLVSVSELVTIGFPCAACCLIFARLFLNQT